MNRNACVRTAVLLAFLLVTGAGAATYYWDDGTINANSISDGGSGTWVVGGPGWEDGTNSQSWADGNAAVFGGTAGTLTLGGAISATTGTFNTAGYIINTAGYNLTFTGGTSGSANTIQLASGAKLTTGTGTTINSDIALGTGGGILAGGAANYGTFSGKITGGTAGTSSLTINGGHTLLNNTANDFLGNIEITSGHYLKTTLSEVIPDSAIIKITNGSSGFKIQPTTSGTFTETFGGLTGTGYQVWVESSAGLAVTGIFKIGSGDASSQFDGKLTTYNGGTSATLALEKIGTGTFTLGGANSYNGGTTVTAGTLQVGTGTGTAGVLPGNAVVNANGTLKFNYGATGVVYGGQLSGTGAVIVTGTNDLQLSGNNSGFTGTVTVDGSNAQLRMRNDNAISGAALVLTNGGAVSVHSYVDAHTITVGSLASSDATTWVRLGSATNNGLVVGSNNQSTTFAGVIKNDAGGTGFLTKNGNGTLTLSGNNTYTGATTVNGGTLLLSAGALASAVTVNSTGTFAVSGGTLTTTTTVNSGGQLQIRTGGGVGGAVNVASGGALVISGSGTLNNNAVIASGGTLDVSGATGGVYSLGASSTFTLGHTGAAFTDVVTGGTLATGGGALRLGVGAGTVATLTSAGGLTLNGGTVYFDLSNDPVTGANDRIELAGTLDLSAATTLAVNPTSGALGNGSYPLVTYAALSGDVANLALTGVVSGRQSFALSTTTVANTLTLDVAGVAANLVWNNAAATGLWSVSATDVNWDNGGANDYFRDGDHAVFQSPAGGAETVTLTGTLQPTSVTATPATGETWTFGGTGTLTGPGTLTLNGAGALALATGGDNTFTGAIAISNGGTLRTPGYTALASGGAITLDNGTLEYQGGTATTARPAEAGAGGGTVAVTDSGATLTLGGIVSGTGALTKDGPGTLAFTGANTRIGTLTIAEGRVTGTTATSLGAAATDNAVVIEAGAALDLAGVDRSAHIMNLTLAGTGVAGSGAVYNSGGILYGWSGVAGITLAADATVASNSRWDVRGEGTLNLEGFTLTKIGTADLIIKSTPGTAGTVHVAEGLVSLEANFNNASTTNIAFTVAAGASLGAYNGQTISSAVTLNGPTARMVSYGGTSNIWKGTITLVGGGAVETSSGNVRFDGTMQGDGNLTVTGTTAIYMTGTHAFTGAIPTTIDIQGGYLEINGAAATLVSNAILNLGTGASATRAVDIWSGDLTVRGLTGGTATTKIVSNGGRVLILNTPGGETYDFAGVLDNQTWSGAVMAVTQQGAGTQTLSGANTYTGATTVNGGTLHIGAAGSLANTAVTVNSGGTLQVDGAAGGSVTVNAGGKLSGTGTITGVTAVQGTVAPGASAGTLTVNNDVWLDSTAALDYELSDLTSDRLTVNGALTLDGTLNVTALGALTSGAYTLITYTGGLTDNGLVVGAKPDARSYVIDTATPNEVRLVISDNTPYAQWWKDTYGVEPPPPEGGDYDGDGTPNGDEFAAKTNPTDNTSYLHLTNVAPAGNDMTVSVFTGGATYDLERTDDLLGSWTDIGDITGNDAIQDVTDTGAATGATWFYRAKVK